MSINRLIAGEAPEQSINLKSVLSVVSEDLRIEGARKRLMAQIEPGSELARPKLVGFHGTNPQHINWAIYLNKQLLFDDKHHLTDSLARALVHLELVYVVICITLFILFCYLIVVNWCTLLIVAVVVACSC